jgi:zinc protease
MKKTFFSICCVLLSTSSYAKLNIQHWQTSQGSEVYFIEAPSVPMLDINVDIDAGERHTANKPGLATLTQTLIGKGTKTLSEQDIADKFADIAAQRGDGISQDRANFTLRTLTSTTEKNDAIALFTKTLTEPQFPNKIFEREKSTLIITLKEKETQPEAIAKNVFLALMYPNHPYGKQPTPASVSSITHEDIISFYQNNYTPKRAVISMIGAISTDEAKTIAENLSKGFNTKNSKHTDNIPKVAINEQPTTAKIPHPASQAHILIGMPSLDRRDPNIFILTVGNYILGGGSFQSRLMKEIREKRGLAYSIHSSFNAALQSGHFEISFQTQKKQAGEALKLTNQVLENFLKEGPTQEELEDAKNNLINGFPLRIDSNKKILSYLAVIGFYKLPQDYLESWTANIASVSLEDVKKTFAKHVQMNKLTTVIVGGEE